MEYRNQMSKKLFTGWLVWKKSFLWEPKGTDSTNWQKKNN